MSTGWAPHRGRTAELKWRRLGVYWTVLSGAWQSRSCAWGVRTGEERVMEAEVDLAALVQAAGDAIIVADPEGHIVFWNPAAERLFGFTAVEALGHSLDLIIPERFRSR